MVIERFKRDILNSPTLERRCIDVKNIRHNSHLSAFVSPIPVIETKYEEDSPSHVLFKEFGVPSYARDSIHLGHLIYGRDQRLVATVYDHNSHIAELGEESLMEEYDRDGSIVVIHYPDLSSRIAFRTRGKLFDEDIEIVENNLDMPYIDPDSRREAQVSDTVHLLIEIFRAYDDAYFR